MDMAGRDILAQKEAHDDMASEHFSG
jgi:hypothetical protein